MTDDELAEYIFKMPQTCTLDMSEMAQTLQTIGDILELSRERVRQIAYWKKQFKGGVVRLLESSDFRGMLKGYYGCKIKSSESS